MLRALLPAFVAVVCMCGCDNKSSQAAPSAPDRHAPPAVEKSECQRDTICTIAGGRREVARFDHYHDGRDSPIFRARVESIARQTCGLQNKGMQVLGVRLEDVVLKRRPTWSVMHLQFACSGSKPMSPTAPERLVSKDRARREDRERAALVTRDRLLEQRAADPAYASNVAEGLSQNLVRYRFVVAFNSLGSGPDPAAATLFRAILAEQESTYGYDFNVSKSTWGQEGEFAMWFMLDELHEEAQRRFVEAFRTRLRTDRASISENAQCSRAWYRAVGG